MNTPPFFTTKEKEKIFVGRTQTFWPENWAQYKDLISHEVWSKEQMAAYNFKKRLEILAYAYEHSPFYHRLYSEQGIHPNDVKTEADWQKLPIITKEMYRAAGEEIVVDAMRPSLAMRNTGGSTGEPLKVYDDRAIESLSILGRVQGWWAGRNPGELFMPEQGLLGQDTVMLTRDRSDGIAANRIRRWPQTWIYLDVWKMDEATLLGYVQQLQALGENTYHLRAYTGSLHTFAQYCDDHQIVLPMPISLHCVASMLTVNTRVLVEKVFRKRLMDVYATNELGAYVATEHFLDTSSHNLYVQDDLYAFELVAPSHKCVCGEEEGETVVTSFINHVAPLIRYNQGDRTHYAKSNIPLPLTCIAPLKGRVTEFLITKDGVKLSQSFSSVFTPYLESIKAFQYRQKSPGAVRILIVPYLTSPSYKTDVEAIVCTLTEICNHRIHFSYEFVETIPHDGGKFRFIVQEGDIQ